ncbi:MAG TPA: copper transporter [Coriobacteriia bacterium]|nr:copper transporter [Coriobacteriia bacterium]
MYNLRYHIASLVSVFLALALGLVLGGLIVQRGTFATQSTALVEGLRNEFSDLREDNRTLTTQNENLDAFSGDFVDAWSQDRLTGRTFLIVGNGGRTEGIAAARGAIEGAGGSAAVVTILSPGLGLDDAETRAEVTSLAPDAAMPLESIAAALAAEWFGPGGDRTLTNALTEAGIISVSDLPEATQAAGLVDLAAVEGEPDDAGLQLAIAAKEALTPSVAAQTPVIDTGVAAAAAGEDVAAFDTLGTEIGRYTLVTLLGEPSTGYYGTAQAADALFPPIVIP